MQAKEAKKSKGFKFAKFAVVFFAILALKIKKF